MTTSTPEEIRALTERAAKRMGYRISTRTTDGGIMVCSDTRRSPHKFDPAHNDADSRLLARRLRIDVWFGTHRRAVSACDDNNEVREEFPPNATDAEIGAAERLAVLRVAGS